MRGKQVVFFGILLIAIVLSYAQLGTNEIVSSSAGITSTHELDSKSQFLRNDSHLSTPASASLSVLNGKKTAFYGTADDDSIRNLVGYADYVVVAHALYNDGEMIKDNVRYLATQGVKVILDTAWWDVWPFVGVVNRYSELHVEDLAWGMNGTETVKYRIRNCIETIGSEYIWGVTIDEEVGDPNVENFPWPLIAWYQNLFCDWMHEEYPGIQVLAWPAPPCPEFISNSLYHIRADGVVYDNYDQNITRMGEIASFLRSAYPEGPVIYLVSAAESIPGWFTCHPPTYLKRVVSEVARFVDVVGFWTMTENGLWGWEDEQDPGYQLALRVCNQIHLNDWHTIYGNTEWFECGFSNDTVTDSVSNWNSTYWYEVPSDPSLDIQLSTDRQVGAYSINLTCMDSGTHSYWWQFGPGHYQGYPDWPDTGPYGAYNLSAASRITFWVKGSGWPNHPEATVRIFLEKSNYPAPSGKVGNLTLSEITPYLFDGAWHQVTIALPLDSSAYYEWDGYVSQIRVEVDYGHSILSDTTSIFLDGWLVDSFDTGRALGLNDQGDVVAVNNGTLEVDGGAYFESSFPQTDSWYYQYSGNGAIQMCINGSWTDPPDEGMLCHWNVTGVRLFNGSFDWIKINAIPPLVEILSPDDEELVSGVVAVQVNATDDSGINRVEFAVDGVLLHTDLSYPYSWDWDTTGHPDGAHRINVTAYATSNAVNFYHIQVNVDNTKPSVMISTPLNESIINDTIQISADASDASGIIHVMFYIDGTLLATDSSPPFGCSWNTLTEADGLHNITCLAEDEAGKTAIASHLVVVDNSGPSISIHSVSIGAQNGFVAVNTSDPSGIDRVEFYLNGTIQHTDTVYPYEWSWSAPTFPDGAYTVTVLSYDGLNHSSSASSGIEIDTILPTLSVAWTPSGTHLRGIVAINVTADDVNGIAYVEFYVNGVLQYTDYSFSYEWLWDTPLLSDGSHLLSVLAVDNKGNTMQLAFELEIDNTGPAIFINSPANLTLVSGPSQITVIASVQDTSGVGTVLLSYYTGASWTNASMTPSGTYYQGSTPSFQPGTTVLIRVFSNDTLGSFTWSLLYSYEIVDVVAPSLDIQIIPAQSFVSGTVQISATVSDLSSISMVILHVDGAPIAWLYTTPYIFDWDTSVYSDGAHIVKVWVNDTWNNFAFTEITINTDNTGPSLSVTAPSNGTLYDLPTRISVEVSTSDPIGLSHVLISYSVGTGWMTESMVLSGSKYIWNSTEFSSYTVLTFMVFSNDTLGNGNWFLIYECIAIDQSSPTVGTPSLTPQAPTASDAVLVTVSISDYSGVDTAILSYQVDSGPWANQTMVLSGVYWAHIPAMETGSVVSFRLYTNDTLNHWTSTPIYMYTVIPFDVLPPTLQDYGWTPSVPDETQTVEVSVNITDPSAVVVVLLSYHNAVEWSNITMDLVDGFYIAEVPPCPVGTVVTLKVYACDSRSSWGVSPLGSYTVASSDLDGPQILLLEWAPYEPTEEDTVLVYTELSDASAILQVILSYGYEGMLVNTSMSFNGTGYLGTISPLPVGMEVSFCVYSCDNRGNCAVGEWSNYIVKASDLTPPVIDAVIWSPSEPLSNESIEIMATVTDANTINLVLLEYFDGSVWRNLTMHKSTTQPDWYSVLIPPIGAAATVTTRILALDAKGNWGITSTFDIEVQQVPPPPPQPTISMSDILFICIGSAVALGIPAGIVVGLGLPRLFRRRAAKK